MQQEELLLVCEVFRVYFDAPSLELVRSLGHSTSSFEQLPPETLGGILSTAVSFAATPALLEAILAGRLVLPGTNLLDYLGETHRRAGEALSSTLNQTPELSALAREARQLITNYIGLAVHSPELFPDSRPAPDSAPAAKAQHFLQQLVRFRDTEITQAMLEGFEDLPRLWVDCRAAIISRLAGLTVFSPGASDAVEAFAELTTVPELKELILQAVAENFALGAEYESKHVLGAVLGLGPVPRTGDPAIEGFRQAVYLKLKACHTLAAYRKTCSNLLETYRHYKAAVLRLFRQLMKNDVQSVDPTAVMLEFFRRTIDANAARASLGFLFSAETQAKVCSHSYAFLLGDILLDLGLPVALRADLLARVKLDSVALLPEELPQCRMALFGLPLEGVPQALTAPARFFFFALETPTRFFVPALRNCEQLYRGLERLQADKKKHAKGSLQRVVLRGHARRLKTEFMCYRLAAEDSERRRQLAGLHSALFEKCIADRVWIPEHVLVDYAELHGFFANIISGYFRLFKQEQLSIYLRFLDDLLDDHYAACQAHVRPKFTEVLFVFNVMEKGSTVGVVADTLSETRLEQFLRCVLGFFAAVDVGEGGSASQEKFRFRLFVAKFLLPALEREEYQRVFLRLVETRQMQDFFGHLLTDMNYFLETTFSNLEKLTGMEQVEQPPTVDSAAETPEQLRQTAASYLGFGRNYLRLFERISQLAPQVCGSAAWGRKVAALLNFYAAKLCTQSYRKIKVSGVDALGLKPLDFIRDLVLIYARLGSLRSFQEELLDDARCFSLETMLDIGATARVRNLVLGITLDAFDELVLTLQGLRAEHENWNRIVADPPEEFLCQLTFELMTDPVQLPASKAIVERKSINEHFVLNGHYDPFNRTRLDESGLLPLAELKSRLQVWVAERRQKFLAELPAVPQVTADGEKLYGPGDSTETEDIQPGLIDPFARFKD